MKRRAKARAHPAKTCPEHLTIKDRPKTADTTCALEGVGEIGAPEVFDLGDVGKRVGVDRRDGFVDEIPVVLDEIVALL